MNWVRFTSPSGSDIWLNAEHISGFTACTSEDEKVKTQIYVVSDDEPWNVQESLEEVLAKL